MNKTYQKLNLGVENSDQALIKLISGCSFHACPIQQQSPALTHNIQSGERTIFYLLYSWLMNSVSQVTLAYPFDCKFLVETAHQFPDIDPLW